MIKSDRIIIKAVLKLTDNYHDEMTLDKKSSLLLHIRNYREVLNSIPLKVSREDAVESIERLLDRGLLRKCNRWNGGYSFTMTSLLKHRRAFWWDDFTKKFWGGFWIGFATAVATAIVTAITLYIKGLWTLLL